MQQWARVTTQAIICPNRTAASIRYGKYQVRRIWISKTARNQLHHSKITMSMSEQSPQQWGFCTTRNHTGHGHVLIELWLRFSWVELEAAKAGFHILYQTGVIHYRVQLIIVRLVCNPSWHCASHKSIHENWYIICVSLIHRLILRKWQVVSTWLDT